MAQISWIGRLLAESNGVITHVKFLAKVATLFGKKIWLCHGLAVIYPPPSERSSRQRNKTSRESAAAAVWKSCYSKATLYFSIMLKFDMVNWVFRRLCVLWLIVPLDTFRFIHNQPHDFSCQQSEHNTIFLQVLESSLFGDKRFSPDSDLRHWKWRGPLHHFQYWLSERLRTSRDRQGW